MPQTPRPVCYQLTHTASTPPMGLLVAVLGAGLLFSALPAQAQSTASGGPPKPTSAPAAQGASGASQEASALARPRCNKRPGCAKCQATGGCAKCRPAGGLHDGHGMGSQGRDATACSHGKQLRARLGVLTEEVQRLKEKLELPDEEKLVSVWGLGPAASRVYRTRRGLSLGGYGEMHLELKAKDKRDGKDFNTGDMLRYVQYIGYKFTDKLLINVELEFEHANTGSNYAGKGGEVSVEFATLEYLAHPMLNLRAGVLLVPIGFVNELHEPPFFHGNLRPLVESAIIPSTWRELGVGAWGQLFEGLRYKLYGLTGLNGLKFGESGWRGGRQKGGRPIAEDFAGVLNLTYDMQSLLQLGVSVFYGGADHSRLASGGNANTLMVEGHAQLRYAGLELRLLGSYAALIGARDLSLAVYPDSGDPAAPETRLLGSSMYGWYGEIAYDIWPRLFASKRYLAPYFRFEMLDSQASIPEIAGRTKNAASKMRVIEAGLTFKPHPQVALKLSYRDTDDESSSSPVDSLFLGAGFVY